MKRRKPRLLLINILFLAFGINMNVFSQDMIILKTGDEIKAIVNEVDISVIKYKKFENLTGPTYTLEKSKVFIIKYQNGSKDVFGEATEQKKAVPIVVDSSKVGTPHSLIPLTSGSVSDKDNNVYKTITIGAQTWMTENLRYKANNACWAYDDSISNVVKYGYLYNYYIAMTVCPAGWHIPSEADWKTLVNYLGGEKVAGSKLRETGFSALPAGFRNTFGVYSGMGTHGLWWCSNWNNTLDASYRLLNFGNNKIEKRSLNKLSGFSVRCIKD